MSTKYAKLADHSYASQPVDTNTELIRLRDAFDKAKAMVKQKDKEVKCLRQKLKRRDTTISSILHEMEELKLLSSEQHSLLKLNFDSDTLSLIENELKATQSSVYGRRYTDDVKNFAVTLQFYSAQAYDHVRKFLALPHPSTIRKWASSRNCSPGFLVEVMETLKRDMHEDRREVVVMFDSMHLKKAYSYDTGTQTYIGSVNYGHLHTGCEDTLATEALVFMVVGLKKHFKLPIGYFLIDKISSDSQAQILRNAITLVTEAGHSVVAVVCDGNYTNQATATALGCNLSDPDNLKTNFKNPVTNEDVYFCFDACHLIKNVRNCLGDLKTIAANGETVKWQYVFELNNLQQKDNLVLANQLRGKHIHYEKNKMNVKLATQTLSSSVASAIDFLREDLNLPQFKGSEATTHFIKTFDKLFDLCNSSSHFGKGFKSPITQNNMKMKEKNVEEAFEYIKTLTDGSGKPLIRGRRKTGFVGFLCTLKSTIEIAKSLLVKQNYRYFLTHRLSQDHLETFFSRVRRRHGWNNNPTPLQFKWALRALLLKNRVLPSSRANCAMIEEAENTIVEMETEHIKPIDPSLKPFVEALSSPGEYHQHALYYISGYIARTVAKKKIKCVKCKISLSSSDSDTHVTHNDHHYESLFTRRKNNGGLTFCDDMYKIIKECDSALRKQLVGPKGPVLTVTPKLLGHITRHVISCVSNHVFTDIWEHEQNSQHIATEDSHTHQIIKEACRLFCTMIYHHHEHVIRDRYILNDKGTVRHKLTKNIIFLHQ